jgi:hypothetical protein
VQLVAIRRRPVRGVAVALEVDGREAQRSGGEVAGDADHALVHPQRPGIPLDAVHHVGGEGTQDHSGEQGNLHHPGAERKVARPEHAGRLGDADGFDVIEIHRVVRHGCEQRLEEHTLQVGQVIGGGDDRGDAPGGRGHFVGVGPRQLGFVGPRERYQEVHRGATYRRGSSRRTGFCATGPGLHARRGAVRCGRRDDARATRPGSTTPDREVPRST